MSASKPVFLRGCGAASVIAANFAAGNAITISGAAGLAGASDLAFVPSVARNPGTYNLAFTGVDRVWAQNNFHIAGGGGLLSVTAAQATITGNQGDSSNGSSGDTMLRMAQCGGIVASNIFRVGTGSATPGNGPCAWITGTSTSLHIVGNQFSGGGPRSKWSISGITSTASIFTITTTATHDFRAGDYVAVRGSSVAAYNNFWRISSVTATTVVVSSTLNPGAATAQGTAEHRSSTVYISNESGSVNEGIVTNLLVEALSNRLYGSSGVFFDGNRGTVGAQPTLSGWGISDIYADYGSEGIVLQSGDVGSGAPTVFGFSINGVTGQCPTRGVFIDKACGVTVGSVTSSTGAGTASDGVGPAAALHINGGTAAPLARGITVNGSQIGTPRDFQDGSFASQGYPLGVLLENAGSIQDLQITGSVLYGTSLPLTVTGSNPAATSRWTIKANELIFGGTPLSAASAVPSVASASSVTLGYGEVFVITGTTNIANLGLGWVGREVKLMHTGALSYVTGGNLAIAANYAVASGQCVSAVFDGSLWYIK